MNISDNIKRIREEKRLSQAEISRRLNLDPSAYFRLEKRGNKLTLEQIEDIAMALEVKPVQLLGLENSNIDETLEIKKSSEQILEKRIAELEDRIDDKNIIIESSLNKLNIISEVIDGLIDEYMYEKANKWGLLTFEQVNKVEKEPFLSKGTQEKNMKLFKSKGLEYKAYILPEDLKEVIERAYLNDSKTLGYIYRMGLIIGCKNNGMKQITNTFKSDLKNGNINFFTEHIDYFIHRYADRM